MKFDIKLNDKATVIDASKSSLLISRSGVKPESDMPFITLSSLSDAEITVVAFDDIAEVELDKGKTVKFDHTKPFNDILNEFVDLYNTFDSQLIKVTFDKADGASGKKEIWLPRRSTYAEAIKAAALEVEGKKPAYAVGPTSVDLDPASPKFNGDEPILDVVTFTVTWTDIQFAVLFTDDGTEAHKPKEVKVKYGTTVGAAIVAASLTNDGFEATYRLNGVEVTTDTKDKVLDHLLIETTWKPTIVPGPMATPMMAKAMSMPPVQEEEPAPTEVEETKTPEETTNEVNEEPKTEANIESVVEEIPLEPEVVEETKTTKSTKKTTTKK